MEDSENSSETTITNDNQSPTPPSTFERSDHCNTLDFPMSLMKSLRSKANGGNGSTGSSENNSNVGGSGNNSDNSALVSIGNTSFGFNFDSEDNIMNSSSSPHNSEAGDSSDGNGNKDGKKKPQSIKETAATAVRQPPKNTKSSSSSSGTLTESGGDSPGHQEASANAMAKLQSIVSAASRAAQPRGAGEKRKQEDNDSGGYNTDDEGRNGSEGSEQNPAKVASAGPKMSSQGNKKVKVDDMKREERNAREKERSFRISKQINELRDLLSTGGVIVPKGTKSSVLAEAANYIRMLQQHQYRSEIDRHQLVQQIQMIGGGALGQQAASAVRHVAAQNGVWSLGNFGGVPPKSAMMYHPGVVSSSSKSDEAATPTDTTTLPNKIETHDYRYVFNSCAVAMAVASMGGAFIDCNRLFCQLSSYTKQEICSMTIFNLTSRQDLQHAFDLISQMLATPNDASGSTPPPCKLRGAMKNRDDLGLSVALVKGEDGVAKCFCVTLILNPQSPFDTNAMVPATPDLVKAPSSTPSLKMADGGAMDAAAYTAG